ncbi:MAG: branched-chain amino acid transaminase [Chloracidobacterium sp.]|uniref:Branched-chain-amino-acid aminotransferase n=1 Tax=Chloracidobacterium validum TaxID=2821543 RepID=A0ABX8BAP2_9BACT|nr:branched-chain amino acid transaminase [Chloracidobacterium validum]QUW02615.1 branched-chain amino acid transaminase [Chloracidobacterium validum]
MRHREIAFFEGSFVPLAEANINVMTHAFNYGTAVFEGIRGYWSEDDQEIYLFRPREHFVRLIQNASLLKMKLPYDADMLCELATEMVRRNGYREDVYIRPLVYKTARQIGTKLSPGDDVTMFVVPMRDYVDTSRPLAVSVSSWRRVEDNAIPARGKICGAYVNSALAATEARDNGYDEAIVLNSAGKVAEGAAMNVFIVRDGKLVTTPVYADILEGITRHTVVELARWELGIETEFRPIDRSELYIADEVFFCGTGAQIAAIGSVDRRPVGSGQVGPVTRRLQALYGDVVRGRVRHYGKWLLPCQMAAVDVDAMPCLAGFSE